MHQPIRYYSTNRQVPSATLAEALPRLQRLGQIIDQEQALAYQMAGIDGEFRRRFPGYRPVTDWGREYELWTRTTMDTLRGTLNAARLITRSPWLDMHGEDNPAPCFCDFQAVLCRIIPH